MLVLGRLVGELRLEVISLGVYSPDHQLYRKCGNLLVPLSSQSSKRTLITKLTDSLDLDLELRFRRQKRRSGIVVLGGLLFELQLPASELNIIIAVRSYCVPRFYLA